VSAFVRISVAVSGRHFNSVGDFSRWAGNYCLCLCLGNPRYTCPPMTKQPDGWRRHDGGHGE
jgi:hypothetical protein